jgi:hypothetical protein
MTRGRESGQIGSDLREQHGATVAFRGAFEQLEPAPDARLELGPARSASIWRRCSRSMKR